MSSDPPNKDHSKDDLSKSGDHNARTVSLQQKGSLNRAREICSPLTNRPGVHTASYMSVAGFEYTGDRDAARCKACGLQVSNWTLDMKPFIIHAEQKPDCPFIRSVRTPSLIKQPSSSSLSTTVVRNTSTSNEQENPSKRLKIETIDAESSSNTLFEADLLQQVRRRTFSHWPHRTIPSTSQMIKAGFFNCNVGDRVICTYCNLFCQQWKPHTDDPCEVHKTISPNCPYVQAKLIRPSTSSLTIVNESSATATSINHSPTSANHDPLRSNEIVFTAVCNPAYAVSSKRHASFATWPHENLPPADDLVRAGFFYTGTKTIVTCFYCNGSLQNWGPNDNPMIEHARWFPHCAYAKQLCGDEMYQKIQESKRAQQERARANEAKEKGSSGVTVNTPVTTNNRQLLIPDESTLSRLVAARLDLPISQRSLNQDFKLSIIKRCWEDQLRFKQDDFASDCDLHVACTILQKQIEHIDGSAVNFTEERTKTTEREKSFCHWPHQSPSQIDMLTSGWSLDTTKGKDFTMCPYCGVKCDNWEPNDNPLRIHGERSPSCPYILSSHPMHPSSIPVKRLDEILTKPKIAIEVVRPTSSVISISQSYYAEPPKREASFSTFLDESPEMIEALVDSGFYYTGTGTRLQCYNCGGTVDNLHQYPANEINIRHRSQFPHCRFAQLLPRKDERRSTSNTDLCKWCLINPKELAAYPCYHLAICRPCAQLTNSCPMCGIEAEAFFKLYM